jgi:hypothetical protein
MSSFLQKIKDLFVSEEKKFSTMLLERLEETNFINIRKLESKLSLEKRYITITNLLSSKRISGVFLPEKSHFFSISEGELSEIRDSLKKQGMIEISQIKNHWAVTDKTLVPLLNHLEKGIIGDKRYYTISSLQNSVKSSLARTDEYEIKEFEKKFGIETDVFTDLITSMIEEKVIDGVLKDDSTFLSSENFENILNEYLEDKIDINKELSFDEMSSEIGVSSSSIERFLVKYVDKNPNSLVLYPLEKKIIFKG